jgi:NADPH2:quinone reductase
VTGHETFTGRHVTSRVRPDGHLELALAESSVAAPGPDEVVVRVEATPINPSDVGLLLAGADPATATVDGAATVLPLAPGALAALDARLDRALPVGNEGAGTVVAAGEHVADLLGRVVAVAGGGMWAQYRRVPAAACLVLDPAPAPGTPPPRSSTR